MKKYIIYTLFILALFSKAYSQTVGSGIYFYILDSVTVGQSFTLANNSFGQSAGTIFVWHIEDMTSSGYKLRDTVKAIEQSNPSLHITHSYLHEGVYQISLGAPGWATATKTIRVKSVITAGCNQYVANYTYPNCEFLANGSFEDYTGLGSGTYNASVQYACPWNFTAGPYTMGSADHYHMDNPNLILDVPTNSLGFQNPSEGKGYVGLTTHFLNGSREYFHAPLKQPLQPGNSYIVSFKASLAEGANRGTRISACLVSALNNTQYTQNLPGTTGNNIITIDPAKCVTSGVITDATNWTTVAGTITGDATLPQSKIIIGQFNFFGQPEPVPTVVMPHSQYPHFVNTEGGAYYFVDEVSVKPNAYCHCSATKSFGTSVNSITYTSQLDLAIGQSASIIGSLVVNTPIFTFNNNNIKFAPGSKITVPVSSKLQLVNGSVLEACTDMWQGIDCTGEIYLYNSTIRDAHSALNFVGTSKWNIQFSVLENNRRHIYVNGGTSFPVFFTTNIIRANKLRCNPAQMKSPYAGQYTYNAVEVTNVGGLEFGKIDVGGVRNEVSNAHRGIYAKNVYKLDIYNNYFENIKCYAPLGTVCGKATDYNVAIYAVGDAVAAAPTILNVGSLSNTMAKNTFNNCTGGVYTQNNAGGVVVGNDFSYIRDYGIFSQNNKYTNNGFIYYDNYIRHAKVGIYVYDNGNNTLWVVQNTITKIADFNSLPTYGVRIENPLRPSLPNKVNVSNNTVTRYRFGIYLNQTNRPYLNGNQVNTHATLTDYPEGIRVDNSGAGDILENNIREYASDGQSIGIRVEYSPGMSTICNNTYNNHIGMFFGGDQPASRVGANYMHNGKTGIHINYGNIGAQGVGKTPHMNAWVGSTWASHLHNTASSLSGQGDNSQFALKYPGTVFYPQPFLKTRNEIYYPYISTLPLQNNNPIPMFVTSCRGNLDNPDGIVEILFSDTLTLPDSALYKEEIAWTKEMMLYRAIKEDTTGSLDPALYQYKASLDFTSKGLLDGSKEKALAGDFTEATMQLQTVNPEQEMETKMKAVYASAYLLLSEVDSLPLSGADSLLLNALALECPYQYGEAVYSARNLLLMYNPDALFINACEAVDWGLEKLASNELTPASVSLAKVYPNPSSDDFVVLFENIQEAAGAEVMVADMNGRTRGTYFIYRNADMILIPGHALEAGMYICTIKIHGEVKETIKIEKL